MERPHHENAKLEAELAALAARHEKALVEGAARLAERDEARAQIAVLTKAQVEAVDMASEAHRQAVEARAQIAAKDAALTHIVNECSRFPIKDGLAFRCESIALNALEKDNG